MEHAIELDPRHVTPENARHLARLGVNRASLGVQTLDPAVQREIGRVQPLATVAAAVECLRAAGISAINFDLMFGLPLQTPASIEDTARQALELAPTRFAIFGYAHVPWMKSHQKLIEEAALPDAGERLRQAAHARAILESGGYVEIGIDHFARPDDELTIAFRSRRLRRNFQGYTTDSAPTLIGIGASSISRTPAGFAQNAADNAGWRRAIEAGRLPTVRGKAFEGDDLLRADIIAEVLCYFEVDLAEVTRRHGTSAALFAAEVRRLAPMVAAGWVEVQGSRVSIKRHRRAREGKRCQEQKRGRWNQWQHYASNAQPCGRQTGCQPKAPEWHGCWLLSCAVERAALEAIIREGDDAHRLYANRYRGGEL